MNLLSICLYLADILPNIATVLVAIGVIMVLLILIVAGVNSINVADYNGYSYNKEKKDHSLSIRSLKKLWIPPLFMLFAALIPSTNTVYLIAASEIAEVGYKSEVGEKLQKVVNEKLDAYLVELTSPSEEAKEEAAQKTSTEDKNLIQETSQQVKELAEQVQRVEKLINQ